MAKQVLVIPQISWRIELLFVTITLTLTSLVLIKVVGAPCEALLDIYHGSWSAVLIVIVLLITLLYEQIWPLFTSETRGPT